MQHLLTQLRVKLLQVVAVAVAVTFQKMEYLVLLVAALHNLILFLLAS
jgi:hypothetical protein